MILTVIRGKEQDLQLAGVAAAAVCGAGLTQPFPGGFPSRDAVADGGSLEVICDAVDAPRVSFRRRLDIARERLELAEGLKNRIGYDHPHF
jgi:hypothetical protein